jgi:hypothetical protein
MTMILLLIVAPGALIVLVELGLARVAARADECSEQAFRRLTRRIFARRRGDRRERDRRAASQPVADERRGAERRDAERRTQDRRLPDQG